MIAPSEKHLEDWIVDNLPLVHWYPGKVPLFRSVIARQLPLPSGIADLVCARYYSLSVLELKKGELKPEHVEQVSRYMYDLKKITAYVMDKDEHISIYQRGGGFPDTVSDYMPVHVDGGSFIQGWLIGYDASDRVIAAAHCHGIGVLLYEREDDYYKFYDVSPDFGRDDYAQCATPDLETALVEIMGNRAAQIENPEYMRRKMAVECGLSVQGGVS